MTKPIKILNKYELEAIVMSRGFDYDKFYKNELNGMINLLKEKNTKLQEKIDKAMNLLNYLDEQGLIQDEESFTTLCELRGENNED